MLYVGFSLNDMMTITTNDSDSDSDDDGNEETADD